MTIKDIAKLAGVSPSTVSRILNDTSDSFAKAETRDKVWRLVRTYGYVPNAAARNLKSSCVSVAGAQLACFMSHTRNPEDNPFFYEMVRSIEQAASQCGFTVPFCFTKFNLQSTALLNRIKGINVDGAIVVGRFEDPEAVTFLHKRYRNIVYSGLSFTDFEMDQVVCDGYAAATAAMQYLISCGHRRIGYIGSGRGERRFRAYQSVMREEGLPIPPSYVFFCEYDSFSGYQATEQFLEKNPELPSAIFCANDNTAIAAIRCLHEHGFRVPRDISVISVDDISPSGLITPALTTVHVPIAEMGQQVIRTLESRLKKHHSIPLKIELPYKLLIRESVRSL